MECGSSRRDNHLRQGHTSIAAAMHQDIPILGAKVVAPDVRLRFERKFKVKSQPEKVGIVSLPIRDGPGRECSDKIPTRGHIFRWEGRRPSFRRNYLQSSRLPQARKLQKDERE